MDKNKQISLLLVIGAAFAVAAAMAVSPDNRQIWHLFELLAIVSALVFAFPGAVVATIAAIAAGLAYLPAESEMVFAYARLAVAAGLVGWYVGDQGSRHAALSRLAMVDPQTGLHAYSYFMDRLSEERKRADRFGSRLSLIVLNLDHFKSIGGREQSVEGSLLNDLAQTVKTAVRQVDIVSRYGGEEFAVLLPNTGRSAAEEIAERIRQAVEDAELSGGVKNITISAGLAAYPDHADDELELIDRAEEALMQAVDAGRNRVTAFDPKERATPVAT